jgi:hypothetical protein
LPKKDKILEGNNAQEKEKAGGIFMASKRFAVA